MRYTLALMMPPTCTIMLYTAEPTDLVRILLAFLETQATQIAWIYGPPSKSVATAHVPQGFFMESFQNANTPTNGTVHNGTTNPNKAFWLTLSDTQVMSKRNTIWMTSDGIVNKLVFKVENPKFLNDNVKYLSTVPVGT